MNWVCPECGGPTVSWRVGDVAIDGCETCGGVWFDKGELAAVVAAHAALDQISRRRMRSLASTPKRGRQECPRCGGTLAASHMRIAPEVTVLGCSQCGGVWASEEALRALAERLKPPGPA